MKKVLMLLGFILPVMYTYCQNWIQVGNGLNNDDHCLTTWNNQLIVGGSFNSNGPGPCEFVAKWNGANFSCFNNAIGKVVRAAVVYNGDLVVCGDFWNISQPCVGCNGIARWDGSSWQPLGTGFDNDVLALTVWNGNLIAGGDFLTADGNTCYRLAMWNGTNWVALGGLTTAFDNDVRALAVYNGQLWVGGDFANVNGCTACDRIVKWNGTTWVGGNGGVGIPGGLDSTVRVLHVYNNQLYMGGHFIEVGGNNNCSGIAKYNGSSWSALGTGVNGYVRGITNYNGDIIAGGSFTTAGGNPASNVARWNGSNWLNMTSGMNGYLRALHVYNNELYAGGEFTEAGGNPANFLAKWQEPPIAAFTMSNNTICAGQCVSFTDNSTNSPTSWNWTFTGGTPASSTQQNPSNICWNTPGTYTITLQVCNLFGCTQTSQTLTVLNGSIPNVTVSASPSSTICQGGSTNLTASGASSYSWTPVTGLSCTNCPNPVANPTSTTTYTVTGSNGTCSNTATITVTVDNANITVSPSNPSICPSGSVSLLASGAVSYAWSPSLGLSCTNCPNPVANPAVTTIYTVSGTTINGCVGTANVTVTVGGFAPPLVEGFQNLPFLPLNWSMVDGGADGFVWERNTVVGGYSNSGSCAWFPNNSVNKVGTKDQMITYPLNFSGLNSAKMFFDVAYCRKPNSTYSDTLSVLVSTNCGQTWTQVYYKGGTILSTAPNSNQSFIPAVNQWRTDTINLNAYIGQPSVTISFRNHNRYGNNLYIDNINIEGVGTNPPVANFSATPTIICEGSQVQFTDLSTNNPTSWNWTFSGGTPGTSTQQNPIVTYNTPGTYDVTLVATNLYGNDTEVKNAYIIVNPIPVATATPNLQTICSGQSTNIVLTSNVGGTTYNWTVLQSGVSGASNGSGSTISQILTGNGTATYTITPTANGCVGLPIIVVVTVNPLPVATATPNSQIICSGQSTNINLTSNVGGTTFNWTVVQGGVNGANNGSGSNITQTLTGNGTATYTITPTANGCVGSSIVVIVTVHPLPTVIVGSNSPVCVGDTIKLNSGGGVTYTWTGPNGYVSNSQNPEILNVQTNMNGYYVVTVTDGNACVNSDSTLVTVHPLPTVIVGSNSPVCVGDTIKLNSGGGVTYTWTGPSGYVSNSQNPEILNAQTNMSGYYVVTVIDGNACVNSDSTQIAVNVLPTVTASVVPNDTVCEADIITLNGNGALTYIWNNGVVDGVPFAISNTTTYTVIGTNSNGCENFDQITITVNPLPTVTFSMQDTVCVNNGTVTLITGTPNGGVYSGPGVNGNIFDPQLAGIGTHVVTYSYTDGNGCSNHADFIVVVDECLGITNDNPLKSISIFPNPTKGEIRINVPLGVTKMKIDIIDIQGKKVYKEDNINIHYGQAMMNIEHLSNGVYQVNLTTDNFTHSIKIAIQK
ncbi:MAG: PKD domain-containing protein [Flavobacteriales bacterium]|nr:PKD domain-containing protein [Flavobacteriales bacterium]